MSIMNREADYFRMKHTILYNDNCCGLQDEAVIVAKKGTPIIQDESLQYWKAPPLHTFGKNPINHQLLAGMPRFALLTQHLLDHS